MKTIKLTVAALCVAMIPMTTFAQKEIKLTEITDEIVVDVSPEKAWMVLNSYGDVGSYHAGVASSFSLKGSSNEAEMGGERECTIENGKKDIVVVEKIVEIVEGSHYKYEVTKSENFPIQKFYNTFGVKTNAMNQTVIFIKSQYRLDPGFLTGLAKGKLKKGNHQALISYKHYMETGEPNVDAKTLKRMYRDI